MTGLAENRDCLFYALAFGEPKPLHQLILDNWAQIDVANFVLISDNEEKWRALFRDGYKNIDIIPISLLDYFETFLPFYGVETVADLLERHSDVFAHGPTGWTAGCMRPLLHERFGAGKNPLFWGWIDWDVLLNPRKFRDHVSQNRNKQLLLFPQGSLVWEHVKLFSSHIDVVGLCKSIIEGERNDNTPIDVLLAYHIRGLYKIDGVPQDAYGVHWAYSDKLDLKDNQFPVFLENKSHKLTNDQGREILIFIADTEVKTYSEAKTRDVYRQLEQEGSAIFEHIRIV